MTENHKRIKNELIANFEFDKVYQTMQCLGWLWRNHEPTMGEIVMQAESLIDEIFERNEKGEDVNAIGTGGFRIERYIDEDNSYYYSLMFYVDKIESFENDVINNGVNDGTL